MEETKQLNSQHVFDQSDTYLAEFKQNMKSKAHIRRGSSENGLNKSCDGASDKSGDSLHDELGSLQAELGGFLLQDASETAEDASPDESLGQKDSLAMAEVLKNCSTIKDIDEVEER